MGRHERLTPEPRHAADVGPGDLLLAEFMDAVEVAMRVHGAHGVDKWRARVQQGRSEDDLWQRQRRAFAEYQGALVAGAMRDVESVTPR